MFVSSRPVLFPCSLDHLCYLLLHHVVYLVIYMFCHGFDQRSLGGSLVLCVGVSNVCLTHFDSLSQLRKPFHRLGFLSVSFVRNGDRGLFWQARLSPLLQSYSSGAGNQGPLCQTVLWQIFLCSTSSCIRSLKNLQFAVKSNGNWQAIIQTCYWSLKDRN